MRTDDDQHRRSSREHPEESRDAADPRVFELSLTFAASRAAGFRLALEAVLVRICATGPWTCGEAWVPTSSRRGVKLAATACPGGDPAVLSFLERSAQLGFENQQGLPGLVHSSRRSVWVRDLMSTESFRRKEWAREAGLRTAVAMLAVSEANAVAVLIVYARDEAALDVAAVGRLRAAVEPLGPVLERKKVEEELRARARQQEVVAHLGMRALEPDVELDGFLARVAETVARTLGIEVCEILEVLDGDGLLRVRAGPGWSPGSETCHRLDRRPLARRALADGTPVVVADVASDPRADGDGFLRERGIVSSCTVRVRHGRLPFGVLAAHACRRRRFSANDVLFLQSVATVLATAVERIGTARELADHRERLETLVAQRTRRLEAYHEELRQAERLSMIGTLATGIGHDMSNAMLPVLCRLDALEARPLPADAKRDLAAIRTSLDHLLNLTQGLHLFALDPEDTRASPARTDLHLWWEEAGALLAKALPRDARLDCELAEALPEIAIAKHQLTQAVLHLLANAREALDAEGRVRISAEPSEDARFVRVAVEDNGCGMDADVLRHALEPLFTTKKRSLSTGLGLSTVHGLAKSVGGSLRVESAPGEGTTVVLELPAVGAPPAEGAEGRLRRVAAVAVADPRTRAFVSTLLRAAGFRIRSASDGPGEAALWLTDGASFSADAARRFLEAHPVRRAVLVGAAAPEPAPPGLEVVEDPRQLDRLRRCLRGVVRHLMECTDVDEAHARSLRR